MGLHHRIFTKKGSASQERLRTAGLSSLGWSLKMKVDFTLWALDFLFPLDITPAYPSFEFRWVKSDDEMFALWPVTPSACTLPTIGSVLTVWDKTVLQALKSETILQSTLVSVYLSHTWICSVKSFLRCFVI